MAKTQQKRDGMTQGEVEASAWAMEKMFDFSRNVTNTYIGVLETEVARRRASMGSAENLLYEMLDEVPRNSRAHMLMRDAIDALARWNELDTLRGKS